MTNTLYVNVKWSQIGKHWIVECAGKTTVGVVRKSATVAHTREVDPETVATVLQTVVDALEGRAWWW